MPSRGWHIIVTGNNPPPNPTKQPIDKACLIASIKACIPSPLDLEKLNYHSWSNLFKRFCKTYDVHHHLEEPVSTSTTPTDPFFDTNDSLVVMWMYSTISPKLVDMVIDDRDQVEGDRLANLTSLVSDSSLVTYVINGLRAMFPEIVRGETLPTFDHVRSMQTLPPLLCLSLTPLLQSLETCHIREVNYAGIFNEVHARMALVGSSQTFVPAQTSYPPSVNYIPYCMQAQYGIPGYQLHAQQAQLPSPLQLPLASQAQPTTQAQQAPQAHMVTALLCMLTRFPAHFSQGHFASSSFLDDDFSGS
ncbi:hypothetical protein CTI12_AA350420 [Artemisia annua]|uniref:Uncharacterized protein n=1 Tax=Artemisia annua TaxID=35608 RepID=A0A2U1MRC5_ARTAN|nr:hypothetical protein CTI12_AA350420 [Artemisia annua]